jgi:hypothetical protein
MGFAVHRTDHAEDEAYWLEGTKTFAETDPGFPEGGRYGTHRHPIQGFTWSDFSAKPGRRYTYRVVALKGVPAALTHFRKVEVTVTTEAEAEGNHDVFFNRGAAKGGRCSTAPWRARCSGPRRPSCRSARYCCIAWASAWSVRASGTGAASSARRSVGTA